MSLLEEVRKGRKQGLEALRDELATCIQGSSSARDVAALSRQLNDVLRQLDEPQMLVAGVTPIDRLRDGMARRGHGSGRLVLASPVDEIPDAPFDASAI